MVSDRSRTMFQQERNHNSTKNPLNIDPGSVFNGGQIFILHIQHGNTVTYHYIKFLARGSK